jgi:hypothetical protein
VDHPGVAVEGLGGVDEQRRSARARESRGNLSSDPSGLAETCYDDATAARRNELDRAREIGAQTRIERGDGTRLGPDDVASGGHARIQGSVALDECAG